MGSDDLIDQLENQKLVLEQYIEAAEARIAALEEQVEAMRSGLKPFADYADPRCAMPARLPITNGSDMAKRQLTMGDCYKARSLINKDQS